METFDNYLLRLKQRRTEDGYEYTDMDLHLHIDYIKKCYENGLSVYKCLEFMFYEK